jgi:hypothetical protein
MSSKPAPFTKLEFYLVTPDRWQDLEKLLGSSLQNTSVNLNKIGIALDAI